MTQRRSLDDDFRGWIPQSPSDHERVLRQGLVSLDANVLLDLYRYGASGRAALIDVLTALGDRVWVSHQAAQEFWRNRMSTIDQRNAATTQLLDNIEKQRDVVSGQIRNWAKKTAASETAEQTIQQEWSRQVKELQSQIQDEADDPDRFAYDATNDSIVDSLQAILRGRVGTALPQQEHAEAVEEARRRISEEVPPGFRDSKKDGEEGFAGDYLVWRQSMLEAKSRGIPLVIITGDEKEDWWWLHRGQFLGPRRELVEECQAVAGQQLLLLRPQTLVGYADLFHVEVSEAAARDVERATSSPQPKWTPEAVDELLGRLDNEGAVQADVIRAAAEEGGIIERADIFEIAEYEEDRMLRGFTRPASRITADLVAEGFLPEGVEPMLSAIYEGGVTAAKYEIPIEVAEILAT